MFVRAWFIRESMWIFFVGGVRDEGLIILWKSSALLVSVEGVVVKEGGLIRFGEAISIFS